MILLIVGLILIIFAVLYAVSPIDIIPDFIPIIGWADDVFIVLPTLIVGLWLIFTQGLDIIGQIDTEKLVIILIMIIVIAFVALKIRDSSLRKNGKR